MFTYSRLIYYQGCPTIEVKSMQRSGTEAIRTQLQPSKPKREISDITNSHIWSTE